MVGTSSLHRIQKSVGALKKHEKVGRKQHASNEDSDDDSSEEDEEETSHKGRQLAAGAVLAILLQSNENDDIGDEEDDDSSSDSFIMSLLGYATFSRIQGTKDDDWSDRASHLYTTLLLCLFTIFVSSAQYVGDPITCWCPAEFKGFHVSYTKHYCWVSNTYYIPTPESIPKDIQKRESEEITYYQWVPILFLFMALLFKTPNMIWRMGNSQCGLNMEKLVMMAEETQVCGSPEDRSKKILYLAKYLDRWLKTYRHYNNNIGVRIRQKLSGVFCFFLSQRDGSFLMGFYLFVKLLYCINIVCQFFMVNAFLAMDYNIYGFEVLDRFRHGLDVTQHFRFPRVTLCDFLIRQQTNVHRYTVQCVLPINLFNEKIFLMLWFWLFLLAVSSWTNYAHWLYWTLCKSNRVRYVKKYLKLGDQVLTKYDRRVVVEFAHKYLREDGVFVLRVVAKNSSELVFKDLVSELWKLFKVFKSAEPIAEIQPTLDLNGDVDDNPNTAEFSL